MRSWPTPPLPPVPGESPPLKLHDTSSDSVCLVAPQRHTGLYVCGITPYDATHLGHAATYVTFDLIQRSLRDAGHDVVYVQNITDVDDPLLERAVRDGVEWTDLADAQIDLFREDMTALSVIPPDHYVGVVESIDEICSAVRRLVERGRTYGVPTERGDGDDIYLDLAAEPTFGSVSHWSREAMLGVYAERGGDPDREGKKDPLDPLLWRAAREGEPSWDGGELGPGRPGWHVECTAIALEHLGVPFDIQGGGSDLIFPHHEMSAVQAVGLTSEPVFARCYIHQAMVGYDGEKMSKSRGNLVLVSQLRQDGADPAAIRLALLAQHYRSPWEWTAEVLGAAERRIDLWRAACAAPAAPPADHLLERVRSAIADNLDTPTALRLIDGWAQETQRRGGGDADAPGRVANLVSALLGVQLRG